MPNILTSLFEKFTKEDYEDDYDMEREENNKITVFRHKPGYVSGNITIHKPKEVNDYRELCASLLNGDVVMLNFETTDENIAQRILDAVSGACFAIDGGLQKVSAKIFVAAPKNVELSGDFIIGTQETTIK